MEHCPSCGSTVDEERVFETRQRESGAYPGKVYTKYFDRQVCVDAYDAEEEKLAHYEVCPSQDELRDPECSTCLRLNARVSELRKLAKKGVGGMTGP